MHRKMSLNHFCREDTQEASLLCLRHFRRREEELARGAGRKNASYSLVPQGISRKRWNVFRWHHTAVELVNYPSLCFPSQGTLTCTVLVAPDSQSCLFWGNRATRQENFSLMSQATAVSPNLLRRTRFGHRFSLGHSWFPQLSNWNMTCTQREVSGGRERAFNINKVDEENFTIWYWICLFFWGQHNFWADERNHSHQRGWGGLQNLDIIE